MAYEVGNHAISVPASADLSAKQFLFGTIDGHGQVAVTGAAAAADGVIGDKPAAAGRPCALYTMPGQVVKVMCGAAVANGALLEADAAGKAVTQAAGKMPGEGTGCGFRGRRDHPGSADPRAVVRQAAAREAPAFGRGAFFVPKQREEIKRYVHADSR